MIFRADPNKSIYLFAPSSFPIEHNKAYCRNFCLFFPSYNRGFTDNFGLQFGAFIFPGLENIPLVSTLKYSLPNLLTMRDDSYDDGKEKKFEKIDKIIENISKFISFATGIIYASLPVIAFAWTRIASLCSSSLSGILSERPAFLRKKDFLAQKNKIFKDFLFW